MEAFEGRLSAGEQLLWSGAPSSGLVLRPSELFLIPFSLFWGGFALFWNSTVWSTNSPLEFKLFGLPFLVVGIYVTIGRFFLDAAVRGTIVYGVTDKRVLISRTGFWPTFKSLDIRRLPSLELQERPDGSGTIKFAASAFLSGMNGFGIWAPSLDPTPQFLRVKDVRKVYDLIERQAG